MATATKTTRKGNYKALLLKKRDELLASVKREPDALATSIRTPDADEFAVKSAIQDVTVELSSNPTALVPPSVSITTGSSSTTITVNVPTGITYLTITGTIGGIPVSGSVSVQ